MNTNKALYWIALAAVAFGLSSEYQRGGFACLRDLAGCARTHLSGVTNRAEQAAVAMSVLTGHWQLSSDKQSMGVEAAQMERDVEQQQADIDRAVTAHQAELERAVAAHQVELAQVQARLARAQAALERANIHRMQVFENTGFRMIDGANHHIITICPKNGRKIRVAAGPEMADVQVDVPTVEVGDQF